MTFVFHVMGLFIIYLLLYRCFLDNDKKKLEAYDFLMISNFISQLLYLFCFILFKRDSGIKLVCSRLFFISVSISFSLLFMYILNKVCENSFQYNSGKIENNKRQINLFVCIVDVIIMCMGFVLPINVVDTKVSGLLVNGSYIVSFAWIILSIMYLMINSKNINKRNNVNMYYSLFIVGACLFGQVLYSKVGIVASGMTFSILFLYLTYENSLYRENKRLKVIQEDNEKNSFDKIEFLKKLSREIRMPLNSIDGFSQVISNDENIDSVKEEVKDIRDASNNLIDLVNGILDISMIDAGKMVINNNDIDSKEFIDGVNATLRGMCSKKNLDYRYIYSDNIPKVVRGDFDKIKRVLVNLISNACKYTSKGSVSISYNCIRSGDRCRFNISVKDTGKGISEDRISNIFREYEDVYNKNSSEGIGLAVVDALVGLMNGKVDVESKLGEGSIFTVSIDLDIIDKDNVIFNEKESKESVEVFDASGKRVVVVDDNKLNLKVATRLLSAYNVEVVQVSSGEEFLELVDKDYNFDLILMDDMMPNMSGTETLDIFKKNERISGYSIPVVVLTANAMDGMKNKYIKSGFDDYLAKPIDKFELNRVLKKFLK